jgi:hypothetical protein
MIYYENNWTRYDQFSYRRYKTSCFSNFHPRDLNITLISDLTPMIKVCNAI